MKDTLIKQIAILCIYLCSFTNDTLAQQKTNTIVYSCMPCGLECDKLSYTKAGKCPRCKMELVVKSSIKFKIIKPSEICAYINTHPNTILLDVRTKEEFEGKAEPNFGSLNNAINISIQELPKNLSKITQYKNREIIVYCSHSHRSPQACYMLSKNGFTKIINMEAGMSEMDKAENCRK
jgi:rhodanese-related sulfurtransferase/DNA-directed RNA polymerase subunit RPC12/RpoP